MTGEAGSPSVNSTSAGDKDRTSPMVVTAARALCRYHAWVCNVNADDLWNLESDDFKRMAALAIEAAAAPEMLAALIVAREYISTDRNALAEASIDFDGRMSADDAAAVADYDAALVQIDSAIAKATRSAA